MAVTELLGYNGVLAVFGMGVIVGFLLSMTFRSSAGSKAASTRGADTSAGPVPAGKAAFSGAGGSANMPGVVAAITAAVNEYRKNNS